jgi:hypothetical protein
MNPAAWAWVILAAFITMYVAAFDLWAHFTNHQSMSGRFHVWLHGMVTGPLIFGLWGGVFIALTYHFFTTRNQ